MSSEIEIRAAELQLGDEIKLFKGDPAEPLLKMPWSPVEWWTVSALMGGGTMHVTGVGNIVHRESTIIAECVREITREEVHLDEAAWSKMIAHMNLTVGTEKIRMTERKTFIANHTLTVRRRDVDPEARDLEAKTRYAS